MTLPRLQGFAETVGPGLAAVAQTIADIAQPYKKTEIELRNAIAKNPEIANRLADLEFANPGSTAKVFGPNVQSYAASLAPSVQARINQAAGPAATEALKDPKNLQYLGQSALGFQPSQVLQETSLQNRVQSMEALMASNPEFREDRAFQDVLGKTRTAYANEQAELSATRGAEAFLSEGGRGFGLSPNEILDSVLGDNPNFKVTPKEVGDLFQSPTYGAMFRALMTERLADKREQNRLKIAQSQTRAGFQEDLTKLKVGRALARATEIENANPAAVAAVLYGADDPSVVALGGVTNSKDPNYARFQEQITGAKTASEREGAARDVKRVRDAQGGVVAGQKVLKGIIEGGGSDAEIALQVAAINDALEEAGKITGNTVTASYVLDPERFFAGSPLDKLRSKGVYYFDHEGNPITEESVPSFIGQGKGEPVKVPGAENGNGKKEVSVTPGKPNTPVSGAGTRTEASPELTAATIFPRASKELVTQIDRLKGLPINDRKDHFNQILQENPNLSQQKQEQLKTLLGLTSKPADGTNGDETLEQATARVSAAFDRSEAEGESELRKLESSRGAAFHDEVASNIPAK